ncbi:hypothetical protein LOD99_1370 [Oopsacas minuta]|uniref:Uncharacterized protein n=1 Tax=Oopsacas minuta TaxID=111878 RepID=A0AAV7K7C5_9METZ|nr:hypothetical protein LOD99_1370 [Oopsacas minuta]
MARLSFISLLAVLILFIQILCIESQCSTSNYCFPGECGSSCTCYDGYSSSASCTDCCDHADGSPTFVDASLDFENFELTQSLSAISQNGYIHNDRFTFFYTKYPLNVISQLSYLTSVDLNTGIPQDIKDKLSNGEDLNCALGGCSFIIQGFKSGLVDVGILYQYIYKNQTTVEFTESAPLPTCLGKADNFTLYSSIPTPTGDTFECKYTANVSIPGPLEYEDSVAITYSARGGTETLVYDQVAMTSSNRTGDSTEGFAVRVLYYDYIEPYNCYLNNSLHCSELGITSDDMFYTLNHYSTTNQTITITSVHGFVDELAPYVNYMYSVYMLVEGAANHSLHEDFGLGNAVPFNLTDLPLTITLPDTAGAYSVVLRVIDLADNMRLSRRFVVSDNSSVLERVPANLPTSPNSILQDVSTHNIYWQSDTQALLYYQWKDYYKNEQIVTHPWLNPVLSYNNQDVEYIYSGYDDDIPPMAIQGTVNAHGIIEFAYNLIRYTDGAFEYNVTTAPTLWTAIPDVMPEYSQQQDASVSGDAWVLWIRAIDIFNHELIDYIVIYTEFSSPMITDLGLKVDDRVTQFVQKSKDITDLIISFKAIDLESGIKSVYWDIEYENQTIIATDTVTVDMLSVEECSQLESTICYCTTAHLCFRRLYDITPNPVKFNITELPHLDTFILKVVVTNYANLTNTDSRTIIIDESPPIAALLYYYNIYKYITRLPDSNAN